MLRKTSEQGVAPLEAFRNDHPRLVSLGKKTLQAAGLAVGGAIVSSPLVAAYTASSTEVHDAAGLVDGDVKLSPGHSVVQIGAKFYSESLTNHGIGISFTPDDVTPSSSNETDTTNLEQEGQAFLQDPMAATEGYQFLLKNSLEHRLMLFEGVAGASFVSAYGIRAFYRRKKYGEATNFKKSAKTMLGAGLAFSVVSGGAMTADWIYNNHEIGAYEISGSENLIPGGITTNSAVAKNISESALPKYEQQKERTDAANQAFIETAKQSIDEQLEAGTFTPPEDGQTVYILLSDLHASSDMIEVYSYLIEKINAIYGENTIQLVISAGDNGYDTTLEKSTTDRFGESAKDVVTIEGNHDGETAESQYKSAGIDVVKTGSTKDIDGISVSGTTDPEYTSPKALLGFGKNQLRSEIGKPHYLLSDIAAILNGSYVDETQEIRDAEVAVGKRLAKEVKQTNPSVAISHQASGLAPLLPDVDKNKDNYVSQSEMDALFKAGKMQKIPSYILMYGHWHRDFQYKFLPTEQGGYGAVIELGAAGGASSASSIGNLPFFFAPPENRSSIVIATSNTETGSLARLQEFTTETDGTTDFHEPILVPGAEQQPDASDASDKIDQQKTTSPKN